MGKIANRAVPDAEKRAQRSGGRAEVGRRCCNTEARSLHKKRFVRFSEPCPGVDMEAIRLSNVNELTGNEQLKARTLHEKDDDTRLHSTSMLECNDPPACVGDKGNSSQRRWRFIPFQVTFTDNPQLIAKDGLLFKKKDETLKDDGATKRYYCALFKYLISAETVWEPDDGPLPNLLHLSRYEQDRSSEIQRQEAEGGY